MSLESFRETAIDEIDAGGEPDEEVDDSGSSSDNSIIDDFDWHISMDGYWDNIDERFYGENTPNEPPLMNVPEKLAADMEYHDDSEYATEVADLLDMNTPERYEAVITVMFNDFSTWNWPVLNGGRELTSEVVHFIEQYMPQIVQWRAIIRGEDPDAALDKWNGEDDKEDTSWMDDIDNTSMSDEVRRHFNENVDWLGHLDRVVDVSSDIDDVEIDDDGDWADDW